MHFLYRSRGLCREVRAQHAGGQEDRFCSAKQGSIEYDHTSCHTQDMPAMERVTVTLPADLVEKIDQLERNRSRFIVEAVEHELAQRRRDALLQSIQNPHPETTELVDMGLSEWIADLPSDETLVEASAGTPVRWIEGQGWTKESA